MKRSIYKAKLAHALRLAHKRLRSWKAVSNEIFGGYVSITVLSRIANPNDDYYPKDREILKYIEPMGYKDFFGMPISELKRRLENRK